MKFRNRSEAPAGYDLVDKSTPSYSFCINYDKEIAGQLNIKTRSTREKAATLIKVFNIKHIDAFIKAFSQVTSGDGHELDNILTIHSSALFALLMFYDISITNPLEIGGYKFDTVLFEVKNDVLVNGLDCSKDKPSSVDVALFDSNDEVLLLLEVKLTEPLNGNKEKIKPKYNKWIKEHIKSENDRFTIGYEEDSLCAKDSNGGLLYNGGVKQLIAHYIGALNGPYIKNNNDLYYKLYNKAKKIFLASFLLSPTSELLTDNKGKDAIKLKSYIQHISKLGEILDKIEISGSKKVLPFYPFVITPERVESHSILSSIKNFYQIK